MGGGGAGVGTLPARTDGLVVEGRGGSTAVRIRRKKQSGEREDRGDSSSLPHPREKTKIKGPFGHGGPSQPVLQVYLANLRVKMLVDKAKKKELVLQKKFGGRQER